MNTLSLPSACEWGYPTQKISPDELVTAVSEAVAAALLNYCALPDGPKTCCDKEGYSRVSIEIPLPTTLADQLMNGRTGYRAHYSISIEAGERFNRQLVKDVAPLVIEAEHLYEGKFDREFCRRSMSGRFSKFWYPKELTDPSAQASLTFSAVITHTRWAEYWRTKPEPHKGLLAPISEGSSILLNGTFVDHDGNDYEQKPDRSQQLFESGWT